MRRTVTALVCLGLVFGPNSARSQEQHPSAVSSQTSSATTSGDADAASTNAESTGEVIVSPFQATEAGFVSSSEWTSAQLAAAATSVGWVILIVMVVLAVLVALGVGLYLTVKANAGNETAFRSFLRMNRQALRQQVVAGHGPVLTDLGELFAVRAAYPVFARILQRREELVRPYLEADAMEGEGAARLSRLVVDLMLTDDEVVAEWLAQGRISVSLGWL